MIYIDLLFLYIINDLYRFIILIYNNLFIIIYNLFIKNNYK